jgi:hypothetical protein
VAEGILSPLGDGTRSRRTMKSTQPASSAINIPCWRKEKVSSVVLLAEVPASTKPLAAQRRTVSVNKSR